MDKLKNLLFSENGMRIVNGMFFLSLLIPHAGLIFLAYIVWIIYLTFCLKNASSRSGKMIYRGFIGIAAVMILLNIYSMLRNF